MNFPVIVDIVIGLIFVYLILSLIAAEVQELITTLLQWRAKHLKESIVNLLSGDPSSESSVREAQKLTQQLYSHPLLSSVNQEARGVFALLFRRVTWIFSSINQFLFGKDTAFSDQRTAPSYIPASTFATALIERLGIDKLADKLVEEKFLEFHEVIVSKIKKIDDQVFPAGIDEKKLKEIRDNFNDEKITLIQAIDQTSDFLETSFSNKDQILAWKKQYFGEKNELVIVNAGLKPSISEISELIDTGSQTYRKYKEKLSAHRNKRNELAYKSVDRFLKLTNLALYTLQEKNPVPPSQLIGLIDTTEVLSTARNGASTIHKLKIPLYQVDEAILGTLGRKKNIKGLYKPFRDGFSRNVSISKPSKEGQKSLWILLYVSSVIFPFIIGRWFPEWIFGGGFLFVSLALLVVVWLVEKLANSRVDNTGNTLSVLESIDYFFEHEKWGKDFEVLFGSGVNKNELQERYREVGRAFQRRYQKLLLDYADVDLLVIPTSIKEKLSSVLKRSKKKIDAAEDQVIQLNQEIGKWFDNSMERASGVYKRNAKGIAILIGFLIAVITNVNSFHMIDQLAYDQDVRQALLNSSQGIVVDGQNDNSSGGLTRQQIRQLNEDYGDAFNDLDLPIGWSPDLVAQQVGCSWEADTADEDGDQWTKVINSCLNGVEKKADTDSYFLPTAILALFLSTDEPGTVLLVILGWLITGIAISMGASFWFDLLGKLVNVRNTGGKPRSSTEEKDGK